MNNKVKEIREIAEFFRLESIGIPSTHKKYIKFMKWENQLRHIASIFEELEKYQALYKSYFGKSN